MAGLYIHVPFCKTKCPYCSFYSTTEMELINSYIKALTEEISLYREAFDGFDSVYIGGGTPSILREEHIGTLIDTIYGVFYIASNAEITIEVNPDDLTVEKLRTYKSKGINRLSIGIQSFHDGELSFLKRRHTSIEGEKAILMARSEGFANLGIDLMFAIPGQTRNTWLMTLEKTLSFEPSHISCYLFTIEKGTPFERLKSSKNIRIFSEREESSLYLFTSDFLKNKGYIHYEVSNFARSPSYYSRHNRKYWQRRPYLGLGPSAHSFKDNNRWWNIKSIKGYIDFLSQKTKPVEGSESLTDEQVRLENLILGFRTQEGVELNTITSIPHGKDFLEGLIRSGHIEIKNNRVIPTVKGYLISDRISYLFSG